MDRRLALALLLSGLAVVVSSMLFPPAPRRAALHAVAGDSLRSQPETPVVTPLRQDSLRTVAISEAPPADTTAVETQRATYQFSTVGGAPVGVKLRGYEALNRDSGAVQLVRDSVPLVRFRLVTGSDTIPLYQTVFAVASSTQGDGDSVVFNGSTVAGPVRLAYHLD